MSLPTLSCLAGLLLLQIPLSPSIFSEPVASAPAQEMNFTLEGKITSLAGNKFTVNSEENMLFHVRYEDKTEIRKKDGSPGSGKDLRVGLRVSVAGDLAESGEITAKRIEIEAEGTEKR